MSSLSGVRNIYILKRKGEVYLTPSNTNTAVANVINYLRERKVLPSPAKTCCDTWVEV